MLLIFLALNLILLFRTLLLHRIMNMLEDIIRAPIFFQLPLFALQFAIMSFTLENVREKMLKERFLDKYLDSRERHSRELHLEKSSLSRQLPVEKAHRFSFNSQDITEFSLNLVFSVGVLLFFSIVNYMACYLITTLTIDAMSVGDILYGITWYNMPRYDQYIVQTIIRRSQDAVELKRFGCCCMLARSIFDGMETIRSG